MMRYTTYQLSREALSSLLRGVRVTVPQKDAETVFLQRRPLRIKYGIDPTRPELHIGYLAIFRKLRVLQQFGHTVVLLIGDFTARFGDPTDKNQVRTLRDRKEVAKTMSTYEKQITGLLDPKRTEFRYNSEWYDAMSAEELLRLLSGFTVQQMLERHMFAERFKKHISVGLHEPSYPVLQGFDSFQIKADATIIGQDQLFNELVGRTIQERMKQRPQAIFGIELLLGTDGKEKMSQSLGNHISLNETAKEQYGKLMSLPDNAVPAYVELLTDLPLESVRNDIEKKGTAARDAKGAMARNVVAQLHGEKAATEAEEAYIAFFREGDKRRQIVTYEVTASNATTTMILRELGFAQSNTEVEQLARQGGIRIDGKNIEHPKEPLRLPQKGLILEVGKRKIIKLLPGKKRKPPS